MDANNDFTSAAKKFDSQLEASVTKMLKRTDAAGAGGCVLVAGGGGSG